MSWPPAETMRCVEPSLLGDFAIEEVLYEFEGPCIFTTRAPTGALLLAYLSEDIEGEELLRYVVSTTSERTICDLKNDQFLETAREAHFHELDVSIAGYSLDGRAWTVVQMEFVHDLVVPPNE